jgi:16S rRNA (uracil1498-N3)-methyltransferase
MRVPRLHLPLPLSPGATVPVSGNAFHHVVQVLRLKPGARLILFNGEGGEFQASLTRVAPRSATARVEAFLSRETESSLTVLLAQGIAKGERMDYVLQKAVELGVSTILPLLTERSVVNLPGHRLEKRLHHWRGVVISACEQCGRNCLPTILEPLPVRTWLASYRHAGLALLLDPLAKRGLRELSQPDSAISLLIGPEGGLSSTELTLAQAAGFIGIRLGPRVMRTETAGVAALAALQALWGDMG